MRSEARRSASGYSSYKNRRKRFELELNSQHHLELPGSFAERNEQRESGRAFAASVLREAESGGPGKRIRIVKVRVIEYIERVDPYCKSGPFSRVSEQERPAK